MGPPAHLPTSAPNGAVLGLDDGRANAIGPATVTALDEALTRAEGEAGAESRGGSRRRAAQ